ncbi:MAG: acetyl-CoA C-acyltransferase, partial [Proteobacteria bacterium]|nr:acetyl-CoA C-acyltransferase [Pseudomonadota bacterium]NDD04187.1 acetyl-CoA C-acyltransferase [Pseudomonadota bacterium]
MKNEKTLNQDSLVIVAAKRTAFGAFGGSLTDFSATDLAVQASQGALAQIKMDPHLIDHVVFGNVIPSSSDAAYLARHVGLKTGIPITTPALTLNRLCGSGLEAAADGFRRIRLGEASVVLVGGTENMSQAPFTLRKARFGYRMGNGEIEDTLMAGLFDTYANLPMALTAERLAE